VERCATNSSGSSGGSSNSTDFNSLMPCKEPYRWVGVGVGFEVQEVCRLALGLGLKVSRKGAQALQNMTVSVKVKTYMSVLC
jgi:hypothetical protein